MRTLIGRTILELVEGDISEQETEAVVTAAHCDLGGGQGTDGSIHFKAGPELLKACRAIGGCPIGDAVITNGYNLKARYVIHTVGPVYEEGSDCEAELLACAYTSSLRVASENGVRSVSFPSISTGAFCYPMRLAAPVAMKAIRGYLNEHPQSFDLVRMVLYADEEPEAYAIYAKALRNQLAERTATPLSALDFLGKRVRVTVDRPLGSRHPRHGFIYPINYGFVPGTRASDGKEIDAYVLGVFEPVPTFAGTCIAVIHRTNDDDDKLIVVPADVAYTDEQIIALTEFQERFFTSEILRKGSD